MKREIITTLALDGEKEFKKGLDDAQRQMRVLASESKSVTAAFGSNQNSVEALTAKNKILTQQIDQQEEVVKALERAVRESAEMYGEADKKTDEWRIKLNNAEAALSKMENELDDNEQQLREATDALKDMAKAEDKAADEADDMGKEVKGAGKETKGFKDQVKDFASSSVGQFASVAGVIALATKAIKALADVIDDATNWADDIATLSQQTNIAIERLQEMAYAARFVDTEVETLTKGLSKTVKSIRESSAAGKDYIEITDSARISIREQNGALKDSEQVFYDAIDAIGELTSDTEREIAAQKLFGKSYQEMMPLVEAGTEAIKSYGDEAKASGAIVSDITIAALIKLDDKFEETEAIVDAKTKQMSSSIIRAADIGADAWQDLWGDITNFPNSQIVTSLMLMGKTKSEAEEMVDAYQQIDLAVYASGLSVEEFSIEQNKLIEILEKQGIPATEALSQAQGLLAEGYVSATYAQRQMSEAQAAWDNQVDASLENYISRRAEYEAAITKTSEAYMSDLGGLFDAFDAGLAGSQKELDKMTDSLLENLRTQVDGIEGWADEMDKLSKRGVDDGLLQELRDMGPEAYAQIQALNNATDDQLEEYADLYKTRSEAARDAAKTALEPMADDVDAALKAAEKIIADENSEMEKLGRNLAKGLGDGFDAEKSYVTKIAQDVVDAAVDAAKKAGKIQSPSKLMRDEVGKQLGYGVGVGWEDALGEIDLEGRLARTIDRLTDVGRMETPARTAIAAPLTVRFDGGIQIYSDDDYQAVEEKLGAAIQRAAVANGGYNGLVQIS